MITADNISIQSRLAIQALADMQMEIKAGSHGKLVLRGYLAEGLGEGTLMGDGITVAIGESGNAPREVLFNGIIQDIHIFVENGTRQAIVTAKTPSIRMDREERSRSFQDTGMTYAQIMGRVLAGYGGSAPCEKVSLKTGIPVIQYGETDWQFLKRMAGSAGQAVFCDETAAEPYFKLGLSGTGKKAIFPEDSYRCMVDENYYHVGKEQGLPRTEFLYYQVESTDNYTIGDHAWYKGRTYYIYEKQAEWRGGVLIIRYKLGGENRFRGKKEYNRRLAGLALPGQVVKAEGEKVYLKLDIDGKNGKAAYPYPWSPATGNLLYAMPQPGTKAYLHFPDCHEERAYAGSSMYAGESLPGSPQQRVLGTEHGKQLQLYEDSIALVGGKETGRQLLSLGQGNCVLKVCDGGLSATAAGGVALRAPYIIIRTPLEINQLKSSRLAAGKEKDLKKRGSRNPATGGDASFSMQYEFNGMASQGVLCGSVYEEYLPFDDAPAYEVEYPMAAKILAGIAVAVLVGVVVGAVVFLAAPAAVAVAGFTITAAQIGIIAGGMTAATGVAATVQTALNDDGAKRIGEYLHNSFQASAEMGGALISMALASYAAGQLLTMANPFELEAIPIFKHWISATTLEKTINIGVGGLVNLYAMFQSIDLSLFFAGQKELGVETGVPLYDDVKELTSMGVWQLNFLALMSPELERNARNNLNPKPVNTTSIAQKALLPKIRKIMDEWTPEDKEAYNKLASEEKRIYLEAISSEEEITEDLKQIVIKNGGHLEGLENRIKSPASLFEKIYLRSETTPISEVNDIIRYTEIQSPESLVSGAQSTLKDLEDEGYQILKLKNMWLNDSDPYNGVNVQIKAPNGQVFELQFHTPEGFELKNGVLHELYEQKRLTEDSEFIMELNDKMFELSDVLERPRGIEELKDIP